MLASKKVARTVPSFNAHNSFLFFFLIGECSCHEMWTEQLSRQPLLGLSFVFNLVLFPYFQTKARLSFSLIRGFYSHLSESMEHSEDQRFDFGKMEYGCKHYKRRCKIRAPCCNEVFACRHCHNKSTNALRNVHDRHELVRSDVRQVVCAVCETEQQAAQVCENCGINMGEYFCDICKFYDDDTEKDQFHCNDCGICRVGGRENFFHCRKCGSCYSVALRDNHLCVENSMHHHCPICYEYLFDSLKDTRVLKCGHTMHFDCFREMEMRNQYACPICSKSLSDMTKIWQKMEQEIQETIMPEDYRYRKVWILCNDCNDTTEVYFHIIGHKCSHCNSYNTRTISPPAIPQ